jgi:hypothetical protein
MGSMTYCIRASMNPFITSDPVRPSEVGAGELEKFSERVISVSSAMRISTEAGVDDSD